MTEPTPAATPRTRMPLHWKMALGFASGLLLGLLVYSADVPGADVFMRYVTDPVGQLFLRLLFMLVIPLIFSALMLGVVEIGDPESLGRIGLKTLLYILVVSAIAVAIGMVMVNVFQPGAGMSREVGEALMARESEASAAIMTHRESLSGIEILLNIVPRNPVQAAADGELIAVMFFALMFGIAATVMRTPGVNAFVGTVQGIYEISLKLIDWVIRMAPYAVFALMFSLAGKVGLSALKPLAMYVLVAAGAMALHMVVVFPLLLRFLGGMSPLFFFRRAQLAMLTAFSTSSSSATLPTTLRVAEEELGTPRRIGRFVCTLGATANMNGTALFEGVTVLFLAQFFLIDLSVGQQVLIVLMCVLGGVGAAGVPGGSLPVIAMILVMFGIPPEGLGLILGVDRFLDMCRTCVNVTGDLVGTVVISHSESGKVHVELPE
ncbi:dicarboxylate/amino acid:cation symporter [Novilysobacter antarcticus]|uniref:dicarboxylate/amino acid:cation symporter n=1 Tax=Novilysobacter antarcticus TaxID=2862543 RepID=UPI001C998B87|nr:dicarboxylate/amino acid:cation symporter [Lysobacter antarcticus]